MAFGGREATTVGCEGLEAIDGVHLMVADAPVEFAWAALRLLLDVNVQEAIANVERELVVSYFDWNVSTDRLVKIFEALAP